MARKSMIVATYGLLGGSNVWECGKSEVVGFFSFVDEEDAKILSLFSKILLH